jgi:predicted metal-dependent phosphotriesterase family hydrolase
MKVNTVLGPVDVDELGVTLTHEHLHNDQFHVYTGSRDARLYDTEMIVEEVQLYADAGGKTLFEVTPRDLGRNPEGIAEVARRTGLNILMSTGRYREEFYEPELWKRTTPDIATEFIRDIEDGVDGIRAALIAELGANGYYVTPVEERIHRAAARAHLVTGAPISTHSPCSDVGLAQLDILKDEGVDLRRVVVGHCDTWPFIDYHEAIAKRGAFVQYDVIRGIHPAEVERQKRLVLGMLERGYVDQLLLSQDINREISLVGYGGTGYAYVVTTFSQMLRDAGVTDEQLRVLMVENPRRLLTGEPPAA